MFVERMPVVHRLVRQKENTATLGQWNATWQPLKSWLTMKMSVTLPIPR